MYSEKEISEIQDLGTLPFIRLFNDTCRTGDVEKVQWLVENHIPENYGLQAQGFQIACNEKHIALMYYFLTTNPNLTAGTVFTAGLKKSHPEVMNFLWEIYPLQTPLAIHNVFLAGAEAGSLETIRKLVHNYPELNINFKNDEAFIRAMEKGHFEVAQYLLASPEIKNHVSVHAQNEKALLYACNRNDLKVVQFLLASPDIPEHADITCQDNEPLMIASDKEHFNLVKYLLTSPELTRHADIHARDDQILMNSVDYEAVNIHMVEYLLTSPELSEHANVHAQHDELFSSATSMFEGSLEDEYEPEPALLNYLVFDYGIVKTPLIQSVIDSSAQAEQIEKMFALRDLHNKIEESLDTKPDNKVRPKI